MPHHGDHVRGERSPTAKLTAQKVLAMRRRHDAGAGESVAALARAFGVSTTQVTLIVTGRSWAHVGGPVRQVRPHRIANQGALRCKVDGYELEATTNGHGRLVVSCAACRRRRDRRCMDCGSPVRGKSWRCERHKIVAQRRSMNLSDERNREEVNRRERRRYQRNPEVRRRRNEYKKEWRRQNRRKVLMQKRRARIAGKPNGWATREKYLAYLAAYRERHREKYRALARMKYYQRHPVRPDPKCRVCGVAIPWTPGKGRPALRCDAHNPYAKYRKPKKAAVAA